MHQLVHAVERVADAELVLEDALGVDATQRADAVRLGGPVEDALLEGFVLLFGQCGRSPALGLRLKPVQAVVAVGVAPTLHKAA